MVLLTVMATMWLIHDLFKTKDGWVFKGSSLVSVGLFAVLAEGLQITIHAIKDGLAIARPPLATEPSFAYPSGHSAYSMFIGLWLSWYFARLIPERFRFLVWGFGLFMALLVAESRIYLSQHWLTDILGGVILGSSAFVVWLLVEQRFLCRCAGRISTGVCCNWSCSTPRWCSPSGESLC